MQKTKYIKEKNIKSGDTYDDFHNSSQKNTKNGKTKKKKIEIKNMNGRKT